MDHCDDDGYTTVHDENQRGNAKQGTNSLKEPSSVTHKDGGRKLQENYKKLSNTNLEQKSHTGCPLGDETEANETALKLRFEGWRHQSGESA